MEEPEPVQEAQHQQPTQEVSSEQGKVEPEALFVAAPAGLDIDNLKFKQADAKPGFFQRWLYRWKVQYDNPSTDKMIGLDGSKMRQEMEKKAYAMGFSEEECQQIGKEFAQKYLEDYYLDKSREKEDYFLFSKTFREKQLGADDHHGQCNIEVGRVGDQSLGNALCQSIELIYSQNEGSHKADEEHDGAQETEDVHRLSAKTAEKPQSDEV